MELEDYYWDEYFTTLVSGDGLVSDTNCTATRFQTLFQFSLLTFGFRAGYDLPVSLSP